MSKLKTIILHSGDLPSVKVFVDAISRLKKDHALLSKIRGSKDIEDPESFIHMVSFLESVLLKEKRKLSKDESPLNEVGHVLLTLAADYLTNGNEELIESTGIGEWAREYAKSNNS
jgi:hypothetical protein